MYLIDDFEWKQRTGPKLPSGAFGHSKVPCATAPFAAPYVGRGAVTDVLDVARANRVRELLRNEGVNT